MLQREQIRQLLLHENGNTRYEAGGFLTRCTNPPTDIADTFWASFDRYGIKESSVTFAYGRIPQTPASCDRVVAKLAGRASDNELFVLTPVLNKLPFDYLLAHQDHVLRVAEDVPVLWTDRKQVSTVDHLRRRIELRDADPEDIWKELSLFSTRVDRLARSEWDSRTDQRLYEALLRHPQFTIEKSLAVVDSDDQSWLRVFALDLLAGLKHRPSIPLFVSILDSESDSAQLAAERALVAMADAQIIAMLQDTYASSGDTYRVMIAETLGHMGLPESEQALISLLGRDDLSDEDRTWLAMGLVDLFTTDGFDLLRKMAADENYDPSIINLHDNLPILADAIGRELPEAATWPRRRPISSLDLEDLLRSPDLLPSASEDTTPADIPDEPVAQPVRSSPKVGRNDPCPCGSGKKYKKCCGR